MITVFEEAMDMAEAISVLIDTIQFRYEAIGELSSVLWLLHKNMEQLCDLLAIVETGEEREAHTALEDTAQASETNHTKNITHEEMMSKQYLETDDLHEIPATKGTLDALEELIESAPNPEPIHRGKKGKAFRLWKDGKTTKKIAEECDVPIDKASMWVQEFGRAQK